MCVCVCVCVCLGVCVRARAHVHIRMERKVIINPTVCMCTNMKKMYSEDDFLYC